MISGVDHRLEQDLNIYLCIILCIFCKFHWSWSCADIWIYQFFLLILFTEVNAIAMHKNDYLFSY